MAGEARLGEIAAPIDPSTMPGDARLVFVGRARTAWADREGCPRNLREAREQGQAATIEIDAPWRPALRGLAAGDAIVVLTWMHEARRDLVVVAPRHREAPVGGFSVRAPVRPNPIGLHIVRIVGIDADAGLLTVDALDCIDGTPVLDVKPWLPTVDVPPGETY
jgi:tRNA-Thr(GGU) m(6)t(6)A37 methyltransferase TsaA